jgi:hypothetical protein
MPGISDRVVHAFASSSVWHDVEGEIERSAPDEFYFHVAQLWINTAHPSTKDLRALAHGIFGFREKCSASAE